MRKLLTGMFSYGILYPLSSDSEEKLSKPYYKLEEEQPMLEQLRAQEVSQIILSMPKGVVMPGKNYKVGEPVLIINDPALSELTFLSSPVTANDGQGYIGASGITNNIEFIINESSVLYALWSYIYGTGITDIERALFKRVESVEESSDGIYILSSKPENTLFVYSVINGVSVPVSPEEYEVVYIEEGDQYGIRFFAENSSEGVVISYDYYVEPMSQTDLKQIHNNIFCAMDVYIDAVDLRNDEKRTMCIHCDKVQISTNLVIQVNSSLTTSFTPIIISSIPEGDGIDKVVATITVV